MGPYKRNWFVGGTVLLGLVTLGVLIILFGGSLGAVFAGEKIGVTFLSDRGDGLSDGSTIRYLGTQVGTVKRVELRFDKTPNYVLIHAELDRDKPLPANVIGEIRIPNFLGSGAIIELAVQKDGAVGATLKGGETIVAKYIGLGVLPPEFGDLAVQLNGAVRDFREANVIGEMKLAINNFNRQVTKAGKVMDDVDAVLGTDATQLDLRTAIANFRQATSQANEVLANFQKVSGDLKALPAKIDATVTDVRAGVAETRETIATANARITTVSDNVNRNLAKLALVMDDAKAITDKVNSGKGTLALLLNDPKLYDQIVVGTQAIVETVNDIKRLARGFEQDGVPINLGK